MKTIEDLTVLNMDGVSVAVSELPDHIKNLVEYFNEFRRDEQVSRVAFLKDQSAVREIQREIIMEYRVHAKKLEEEKLKAEHELTADDKLPANDEIVTAEEEA